MNTPSPNNHDKSASSHSRHEHKNGLGISRAVYALGTSSKDAFIWSTAVTGAFIALFGFGHGNKSIGKAADSINGINASLKEFTAKGTGALKELPLIKEFKAFKITTPIVVASAFMGWLAGHLALVIGGHQGWKQAQAANEKYNNLVNENQRLTGENQQLTNENGIFKTEIAKRDPSFAEQLAKQQAASEALVGPFR